MFTTNVIVLIKLSAIQLCSAMISRWVSAKILTRPDWFYICCFRHPLFVGSELIHSRQNLRFAYSLKDGYFLDGRSTQLFVNRSHSELLMLLVHFWDFHLWYLDVARSTTAPERQFILWKLRCNTEPSFMHCAINVIVCNMIINAKYENSSACRITVNIFIYCFHQQSMP